MQINIHKINLSFQKRALYGNIAINLIQMIHCILKLNLYFNKVELMLFFFFLRKIMFNFVGRSRRNFSLPKVVSELLYWSNTSLLCIGLLCTV